MKKILNVIGEGIFTSILLFACSKSKPTETGVGGGGTTQIIYSVTATASSTIVYSGQSVTITFAASATGTPITPITDVKVNGVSQNKISGTTVIAVPSSGSIRVEAMKDNQTVASTEVIVGTYDAVTAKLCCNGTGEGWAEIKEEVDTLKNGDYYDMGALTACLLSQKNVFNPVTKRSVTTYGAACGGTAPAQETWELFQTGTKLGWGTPDPAYWETISVLTDTQLILIKEINYLSTHGVMKVNLRRTYTKV